MGKPAEPTVSDLVVLAVLMEGPRHGYALNTELERRSVKDWAPVSRPQVYYSLKKLQAEGWIEAVEVAASLGPDRRPFQVTPSGREVLEGGLARSHWAVGPSRSGFATWLALSPFATDEAKRATLDARERWLRGFLVEEAAHLRITETYESRMASVGSSLIRYKIRVAEIELELLDELRRLIVEEGEGSI